MERREQAVQLRLAGLSTSQIAQAMGLRSGGGVLSRWLQGVPAPEWTKRPNAKDDLRERAVAMRKEGRSYREIGEALGVSKSTLSDWLKDVVLTHEQRERLALLQEQGRTRAARTNRAARVARQAVAFEGARAQIPNVAESELFVAGVVAYWAEGSKAKPWRPGEWFTFINSDPQMITLMLRWLDLVGVSRDRLILRVSIHETADVPAAETFWRALVGVGEDQFRRPTLKRHNPRTVRKNVGADYHGCLIINVRRSTELYRQIEGWWAGIVGSVA
jgi:transcriptional regulator with XRE-family HTH domain